MLSSRFQQCLGPFTMLLFDGSSETRLFRRLSNHVFGSPQFRKYIGYEGHTFIKNLQNLLCFSKMQIKIGKIFFSFRDNGIWIGSVKLSLFRREYLSSAVNMLTNNLNILHSNKRNFFRLNYLQSYQ